jgi:hypothetical protein
MIRTKRTMTARSGASPGQIGPNGDNTSSAGQGRNGSAPAPEGAEILTSREARAFLRIGRTKLHELTRRQIVPAYRIGEGRTSSLRYLRSDLLGWLVRQRVSR